MHMSHTCKLWHMFNETVIYIEKHSFTYLLISFLSNACRALLSSFHYPLNGLPPMFGK